MKGGKSSEKFILTHSFNLNQQKRKKLLHNPFLYPEDQGHIKSAFRVSQPKQQQKVFFVVRCGDTSL
jgi:hypothetical protein